MTQANTAPTIARQVLWTFRGIADERADKDFYMALETVVASELSRRFNGNTRIWVGREIRLPVGNYTVQARLTNIEPLLATVADKATEFSAQFHERGKDEGQDTSAFIAEIIRYPDERFAALFNALVGIDDIKNDIQRKLHLLLQPGFLENWLDFNYGERRPQALSQTLEDRYPLKGMSDRAKPRWRAALDIALLRPSRRKLRFLSSMLRCAAVAMLAN